MAQDRVSAPDERTPLLRAASASPPGRNGASATSALPSANGPPEEQQAVKAAMIPRQVAPDLLRGILMLFMAIDHVSVSFGTYAHGQGVVSEAPYTVIKAFSPPWPYLLRTLSHLCAPGFSMLMGMGIAFYVSNQVKRGATLGALASHFPQRALAMVILNQLAFILTIFAGLWVINAVMWALAINFVLVGFIATFVALYIEPALARTMRRGTVPAGRVDDDGGDAPLLADGQATDGAQALAANLVDAVLLVSSALLAWVNVWTSPHQGQCPAKAAETSGLHSLMSLDAPSLNAEAWPTTGPPCKVDGKLLFQLLFGSVQCPNLHFISGFPPIGWLAPALFGYLYGRVLLRVRGNQGRTLALNASLAVVFSALFVSTRLLGFGNTSTGCLRTPDQAQQPAGSNQYLASLRSFFYLVKYPPSPAFNFFTLGANFGLLVALQLAQHSTAWDNALRRALLVLGTNSLLFYACHLLLLQVVITLASLVAPDGQRPPLPLGAGFWAVYAAVVATTYLACRRFGEVKARSARDSWLRLI